MSDIIERLRAINPATPYRNMVAICWDAAAVIECQNSELRKLEKEIPRLTDLNKDMYLAISQAWMTGITVDEDTKKKIIDVLVRYEEL